MRLANQDVPNEPLEEPSEKLRLLRAKIIYEEVVPELIRDGLGVQIRTMDYHDNPTDKVKFEYSIGGPFNLVETIDGCMDASVVIIGTLSALGIPDEPFLIEVDNNNLAKFGPGGLSVRRYRRKPRRKMDQTFWTSEARHCRCARTGQESVTSNVDSR